MKSELTLDNSVNAQAGRRSKPGVVNLVVESELGVGWAACDGQVVQELY
jgi:hypothetical protein